MSESWVGLVSFAREMNRGEDAVLGMGLAECHQLTDRVGIYPGVLVEQEYKVVSLSNCDLHADIVGLSESQVLGLRKKTDFGIIVLYALDGAVG